MYQLIQYATTVGQWPLSNTTKKMVVYPATGESSTVKLFKFPSLSYRLKVVSVFTKGIFHSLSRGCYVNYYIPEYSCNAYVCMYKRSLCCLKFWAQEILVRNWIFLSRFSTLYMFMISPFNNSLLNKTITVFQSLLIEKSYFPSNHLQGIFLSFSEFWTIFFLLFFFFLWLGGHNVSGTTISTFYFIWCPHTQVNCFPQGSHPVEQHYPSVPSLTR